MLNTIKEQARCISSSKSDDGEEMPSGSATELLVLVKLSYKGGGCTGGREKDMEWLLLKQSSLMLGADFINRNFAGGNFV